MIPDALAQSIQRGTLAYTYRGVPMWKNPLDLAIYAKLIWEHPPATILEIGTNAGGSALWLADLLGTYRRGGVVISVDTNPPAGGIPDANAPLIIAQCSAHNLDEMTKFAEITHPLLVIEDADHYPETTAAVLNWWHKQSQPGEYIIIEDGNVAQLYPRVHRGGPLVAIREFLAAHPDCAVDRTYADYYGLNVTFNPEGYIRRGPV